MLADASHPSALCFQETRHGRISGIAALSPLPWESGIFGQPMASVRLIVTGGAYVEATATYERLLDRIDAAARANEVRHLSCRVPAGDSALVHAIERSGYRLMDSTLEYVWRPRAGRTEVPDRRWSIGPAGPAEAEVLAELARQSFTDRTCTRFGVDPHLSNERVGELYAQWTRLSCAGQFADVVMTATVEGRPVGFLTCKLEREFTQTVGRSLATIGIGAIAPDQEGTGLFAALGNDTLSWCAEQPIQAVRSRIMIQHVASSWAALRTGARQAAAFHTFHRWLGDKPLDRKDARC